MEIYGLKPKIIQDSYEKLRGGSVCVCACILNGGPIIHKLFFRMLLLLCVFPGRRKDSKFAFLCLLSATQVTFKGVDSFFQYSLTVKTNNLTLIYCFYRAGVVLI